MSTRPETTDIIDPATGQTEADIGAYLSSVEINSDVAIRNTQRGRLFYQITQVTSISSKNGQFRTKAQSQCLGSAWHRKHGKSADKPKGQSRIVIPTQLVREVAGQTFALVGVEHAEIEPLL